MRRFNWGKENEVFLAQIDAEHREIFRIAGGLEHAVAKSAPADELRIQLRRLAGAAEDHLSHEEWLMQSVSYPSYGWHKQQHDTLRRRLKLFIPLIESGDAEATELFLEFLAGWMHDHTSVTDRMMGAFVRNFERTHPISALQRWGSTATARKEEAREPAPVPKTVRQCKTCGEETTHELRSTGVVCTKCAERSVSADLDRD